jgi:hypothetical protein
MSFSSCGGYLACAGAGAREFVLFSLRDSFAAGGEEEGGQLAPLCVCPVAGCPLQLSVSAVAAAGAASGKKSAGKDVVHVLCVLQGREGGCVVRVEAGRGRAAPTLSQAPFGGAVLSGCFASSAGSITLATGQVSAPQFVTIPFLDASSGDALLSCVNLPSSTPHKLASGNSTAAAGGQGEGEVSVLGPHENGGAKRPHISDEAGVEESSGKRMKLQGSDRLTVEERLNSAASSLMRLEALGADPSSGSSSSESAEGATSDSLVTLVQQALQAGDEGLLEQCLDCPEQDVVAETSRRLPTLLVVPLLRKLVAKFEKKPTRGVLLTRWIHGLLRCHMSFLLSVPDLAQQLAALSQMLEQRLATYSRLASLAGRLDLLMSQISSAPRSSSRVESVKLPNQIYYED